MRQETDSMCTMECFSVLFTKFYYFLLILKIISWNWLAILHLYPRWSSQQHIYILFTLSSFFLCLHISPQTEGVRTLQIMSKTSHRAKIHRTGGQNPSYRGQKSNIPCYNFTQKWIDLLVPQKNFVYPVYPLLTMGHVSEGNICDFNWYWCVQGAWRCLFMRSLLHCLGIQLSFVNAYLSIFHDSRIFHQHCHVI